MCCARFEKYICVIHKDNSYFVKFILVCVSKWCRTVETLSLMVFLWNASNMTCDHCGCFQIEVSGVREFGSNLSRPEIE